MLFLSSQILFHDLKGVCSLPENIVLYLQQAIPDLRRSSSQREKQSMSAGIQDSLMHSSFSIEEERGVTVKYRLGLSLLFGLLIMVLAACGGNTGATSAPTDAQTVDVKLSEFSIDVSEKNYTPGKTYHFVITNNGNTSHEFMIMPKSEGNMSGMSMEHMDSMALAMVDDIQPGETKTLDYTFTTSAANTQPEFACYIAGHYEAGMKQTVSVKQ